MQKPLTMINHAKLDCNKWDIFVSVFPLKSNNSSLYVRKG